MNMTVDLRTEVIDEITKEARNQNDSPEKYAASILNKHYGLEPDYVAYWYFRLNGFLTTVDFVVHPRRCGGQRTDADVFGIRFPHRNEPSLRDDLRFQHSKPMLAIAEVTIQPCKINGPWSNSKQGNVQYVLNSIGIFDPEEVDCIASKLYSKCRYEHELATIQMFAVGKRISPELSLKHPEVIQLTFAEMLDFIYRRFRERRSAKKDHQHWDRTGHLLWELSARETVEKFVEEAQGLLDITQSLIDR